MKFLSNEYKYNCLAIRERMMEFLSLDDAKF